MNNRLLTNTERQIVNLAIGRIVRMASRPPEAGDIAEYERCRCLILNLIGDDATERHVSIPLPGWNFGGGAKGVIE